MPLRGVRTDRGSVALNGLAEALDRLSREHVGNPPASTSSAPAHRSQRGRAVARERSAAATVESVGMDERSERIARRFERPMLVAALLVIPLLVLEESNLGQPWTTVAAFLNWGTWLAFLAEVVVMLAVVPDRARWAREHPIEIVVTALTPPVLPAGFAAARLLRLLRVLRLAPPSAPPIHARRNPLRGAACVRDRARRRQHLRGRREATRRVGRHLVGGDNHDYGRLWGHCTLNLEILAASWRASPRLEIAAMSRSHLS